jgi:hypothetical protein
MAFCPTAMIDARSATLDGTTMVLDFWASYPNWAM